MTTTLAEMIVLPSMRSSFKMELFLTLYEPSHLDLHCLQMYPVLVCNERGKGMNWLQVEGGVGERDNNFYFQD